MDEARIVAAHDILIAQDPELKSHAELINRCLEFIDWLLRLENHQDSEHLALLRLGVRCFNSCGAALRLLRCGHWQPTILIIRDLYETQFLLDLLARDTTKLKAWLTLSAKERNKQFKAVSIRQDLDTRDGFNDKKRAERYKMLSNYGAHATPEGFDIISPNGITNIGPYPDQKMLKSTIEELAMVTAHAAATISPLVEPIDQYGWNRKLAFIESLEVWRKRFLNHGSDKSD
jgi:hypothetical protein